MKDSIRYYDLPGPVPFKPLKPVPIPVDFVWTFTLAIDPAHPIRLDMDAENN